MNATRRPGATRPVSRGAHLRGWGLASVLVASLALSACGDQGEDPEAQATATPTPTAGPTESGRTEPREIGTFSATGLRGIEDGIVVEVDDAQGAGEWVESLGATPDTRDEVSGAVETAAVADDETVWGAVLGTGCLAPESWTFTEVDDEWTVEVVPDDREATTTCVAAVTTIAFVAVPNDG